MVNLTKRYEIVCVYEKKIFKVSYKLGKYLPNIKFIKTYGEIYKSVIK